MTVTARAIVLALAAATLPVVASRPAGALPDSKDDAPAEKAFPAKDAIEQFQSSLLETNKDTLKLDGLEVKLNVIPDYLAYLMAKEQLGLSAKSEPEEKLLREKLKKVVKAQKKYRGKAAIRLVFTHAEAGTTDFYCFEGEVMGLIRIGTALGRTRTTVASRDGSLSSRPYTLFKPHLSSLFDGDNVTPVMHLDFTRFEKKPYTLELIVESELSEKSKKLEVGVGNVIHIHGTGGIAGNQIDFQRGAVGDRVRGAKASFDLPLVAPKMPESYADLIVG